ncbi:Gfo/Idh/MocA family oxidoreductase [Isoptericola haloaureus]|uniref:Gfo/Idh/MocA family oxidoreductase n=1 Tax=Isoptericola haloaureus TaxID=1542902 RepID=A0ABU7Z7K8_9MICO
MTEPVTGVGVVGAGVISEQYLQTLSGAPGVDVRFVADRDPERARARAQEFDVPAWGTYDDLLADSTVDLVVNLTVPQAHAEVSVAALESGRHVWSEKPLATTLEDARAVLSAAETADRRVGVAPDTFLGTGLQTGLAAIRDGRVGRPRSASCAFQYGGPDIWHPSPEFLFAEGGGPVLDVGPYHVTALVQVFGPVRRVTARGVTTRRRRRVETGPRAGTEFDVEVPTHVTALYEFADGSVADAVFSFDAPVQRMVLEVAGTEGGVRLVDPNQFTGTTSLVAFDGSEEPLEPRGAAVDGRGAGVVDIARSLHDGTPHRASGELALHVLEVLLATERSVADGSSVEITSTVAAADLLPADATPAEAVTV